MSHFFNFPLNYEYDHHAYDNSVSPRIVDNDANDNDYNTYSTSKDLIFQTHGDDLTDNSRITHLFIKCKGVTNYTIAVPSGKGTGTGLTNQTIPADQVIGDIQHDLRSVGPLMASEVQLTVTGTDTEIYEVLFLQSLFELENGYQGIQLQYVDPGASIQQNINGTRFKVGGLSDRFKHETSFVAFFSLDTPNDGSDLIKALQTYDNFTFAEEFEEWPDRVYPALLSSPIGVEYVGRVFHQRRISFSISEA